jgi:membrane associated rhomboid family serine protease
MKLFLPFLYTLTLYGTFVAGSLQIRDKSSQTVNRPTFLKKTPWTTLIVAGLISAGLILQIILPQLLALCMRNRLLILKGELWRLITALFFQDGGLAGGISNIVGLLFIGSLAEQFWTRKEWLIIFFIGGILSEVAGFWWQPSGAGNSVANLCLAASVAFVCLNSLLPVVPGSWQFFLWQQSSRFLW